MVGNAGHRIGETMQQTDLHARTVVRLAGRTAIVSGVGSMLLLGAWGWRVDLLGARPQLVLMAYMMLLLVAACTASVAAVASMQLATSRAFSMGYATARLHAVDAMAPGEYLAERERATVTALRVVE